MDSDSTTNRTYLAELYRETNGNTDATVSMLDIGTAVGFEEGEARNTAENLMILGLVELKTLSGGIGITGEGLKELGITPEPAANSVSDENLQLGREVVLDDAGKLLVESLITELKSAITREKADYQLLEESIIDLKTIEVQLLSPSPKVAIVREILRSLHAVISLSENSTLAGKLETVLKG
ncbi:MAG: hypothetical protein JRC87_00490 [Deltaproteobacteria bacterium]|nr:hypothetical protein [Deltaproteobacteria bacterium]